MILGIWRAFVLAKVLTKIMGEVFLNYTEASHQGGRLRRVGFTFGELHVIYPYIQSLIRNWHF